MPINPGQPDNGRSAMERIADGESLHDVLGVVPEGTPVSDFIETLRHWLSQTKLPSADNVDFLTPHLHPTLPHHIDDEEVLSVIVESCLRRQFSQMFTEEGKPRFFGPAEPNHNNEPRYELLEEIGRGAQSVVWKAIDRRYDSTGDDSLVALKIYEPDASDATSRVPQFNHPNIAAMMDQGFWQGSAYIAFELIRGVSLTEWAAEFNPTDHQVLSILTEITRGIVQTHNRGLIHRDLKPSNIMMSGDRPVIIDFGVSAQSHEERMASTGSPLFMAPEQADPVPDTALVDVYAIGGIGYWLLTGRCPNGATPEEARRNLANKSRADVKPLRRCRFGQIIADCLAPHPRYRTQSSGQLLSEFESVHYGIPTLRSHKRFPIEMKLRRPALLLSELAVVLTLAVLLLFSWKHTQDLKDTSRATAIALNATNQQTQLIIDQLMIAQSGDNATYWILKELTNSPSDAVREHAADAAWMKSIPLIRQQIAQLETSPRGSTLDLAHKHLTLAQLMENFNAHQESTGDSGLPPYSVEQIRAAYSDAYGYLELALSGDEHHEVLDRLGEVIASFPAD